MNTVIIGSQGSEWTSRGPLFGVDVKTGQKKWEFLPVLAPRTPGDLGQ